MTLCHKISSSLKEILDAFIKNKFRPMTLAELSELLDEDANTINQRILRDNENLFFSPNPNSKPKKIQVKQGHPDVVCYMRDNQCSVCKKKFKPEKLLVEYLNEQKKPKDSWDNLILLCESCKKAPSKQEKKKTKGTAQVLKAKIKSPPIMWEYKSLLIRYVQQDDGWIFMHQPDHIPVPAHFEYRENAEIDLDEEPKWFFIEENGEIISNSIADILNHFGAQGWELSYMQQVFPQQLSNDDMVYASSPTDISEQSVFLCMLKRMRGNA
jgi:5-methylcytosine-specific restriction endonuclease McrA